MSPVGLLKFIGAWGCIAGAVVCAVMNINALIVPLALISVAFSLAPESA